MQSDRNHALFVSLAVDDQIAFGNMDTTRLQCHNLIEAQTAIQHQSTDTVIPAPYEGMEIEAGKQTFRFIVRQNVDCFSLCLWKLEPIWEVFT